MTDHTPKAPPPTSSHAGLTILWAGLVAGALDITYVFVYFHQADPIRVLKGIAAGLLGKEAQQGGLGTAALGLGLHFFIALGAAAVFYAASRKLPILTRQAIVAGLLYGLAVWLVMNLVVLPLSANPPKTFLAPTWRPVLIAHLLCVGLPIALIVRWRSRERTPGG